MKSRCSNRYLAGSLVTGRYPDRAPSEIPSASANRCSGLDADAYPASAPPAVAARVKAFWSPTASERRAA